jgi:NDP-sugar pyrophosphorylase family protein
LIVGFCLAAGAGTRLGPLTEAVAKPLLAPAGRPLLDLALAALGAAGAGRAVVNAHHLAAQLAAWLRAAERGPEPWPATVDLLVEERLLGTGGGLVNAVDHGLLPAEVVLVTCADHVETPADLACLVEPVLSGRAEAAMGLTPAAAVGEPLAFALDGGPADGPAPVRPAAGGPWSSAGTYAVAGRALAERLARPGRPVEPANLVDVLLEPLWREGRLLGVPFTGPVTDAGTLDRFLGVAEGLLAGRWPYRLPPGRRDGDAWVADGAAVHARAELHGAVVVDRGAVVGEGARLTASVIGAGAEVAPGATVARSVVGPGARVAAGATVTGALVAPTARGGR